MNEITVEYLYISCIGENTIKIIDANAGMLVESIKVANRPFDMKNATGNKLYVACDRSEKVEIIDLLSLKKDSFNVSNNGVMDIDTEKLFIYISDGMSVTIYDLISKIKIASADGCLGIENISVEKRGPRLFVIDSLLNQIKIYKKNSLELIASISNVGLRPRSLLISEESDYAYIANEGIGKDKTGTGITIVDLRNYEVKFLEFPKGSEITSLAYKGNILYAANKGLKRIEMISTLTMRILKSIETSGKIPEELELSSDKTKLYIMERDESDNGIIDILELHSCQRNKTIIVGGKDINPKGMKSVSIEQQYSSNDYLCLSKSSKWDLKPISVLVRRVFASYTQKMCIPEVTSEIQNMGSEYSFENIVFKNGFIIEGSLKKNILNNKRDYSRVQLNLRIPYIISLKDTNNSLYSIEGYVEEKKDLVMYMPEKLNEYDYEILIKSKGELLNSPKVHKNHIKFSAGFFILFRVVGEQEVQLPIYNCDSKHMECEEYIAPNEEELFEAFLNFNNTPFPLNLFSVPLEDID
jgi:DNA-binding beta-propeller fold protein YncE